MRVILQEKVQNLGTVGDQVSVRVGYARNYLIPYGKAVPATTLHLAEFEKRRAELEKRAHEVLEDAKTRAEKLALLAVTLTARASDEGRLYGSISPKDIAQSVSDMGVSLCKSEVKLPEGPIRQIGEHEVQVHLHSDVETTLKVVIIPE